MGQLIRMLLSMLALAVAGVRTPATPPACPAWCRGHTTDRQHTRDMGVWYDDNNIVELDLFQRDGEPPYLRIFLGETEYLDVTLAGASILGRIITELDPGELAGVGRGLLGAYITAGGAR